MALEFDDILQDSKVFSWDGLYIRYLGDVVWERKGLENQVSKQKEHLNASLIRNQVYILISTVRPVSILSIYRTSLAVEVCVPSRKVDSNRYRILNRLISM